MAGVTLQHGGYLAHFLNYRPRGPLLRIYIITSTKVNVIIKIWKWKAVYYKREEGKNAGRRGYITCFKNELVFIVKNH